jgi:arylsulfatase
METIDEEINGKALDFIDRAHKDGKPFFVWWNSTHMHFRTHVKKEYEGRSGQGFYNDAMVYHDDQVGVLLKKLDDLGIADNTIVMYSTDNGPHFNSWPDAGITPFRSEKNTNWEGAFRVPAFVRWPGKISAGTVLNGIVSHQDWLPTLLAAAGEPDIKGKLLAGHKAGARTFKVCIDGFNMLPYLTGEVKESPRKSFFYVNDDAQLVALRFDDWKLVFMEQRAKTLALWGEPFVTLRFPKLFNLRRDPFERADHNSNTYWDWVIDRAFLFVPAQAYVAQQIQSLKEFPPRQKPASFNLDRVLDQLKDGSGSGMH